MSVVTYSERKSMIIRASGRSTDYIAPSIVIGCLFDCSYCYLKRHHPDKNINVANNLGDILTAINSHVYFEADVEKPNQTDPDYITYDIGCNSDVGLDCKYWNWSYVFNFFKQHNKAKASFATKYVNKKLLTFDPERKVRIRFSLMPQKMADILEPNTSPISERIEAINTFIEAGYDVHVNFSPIVYYDEWKEDYKLLFEELNNKVKYKDEVLAECIFLTHNEEKRHSNLTSNPEGEKYLWAPDNQEYKTSEFGGTNIRYKSYLKSDYIKQFVELHDSIIPWNTIRYIF